MNFIWQTLGLLVAAFLGAYLQDKVTDGLESVIKRTPNESISEGDRGYSLRFKKKQAVTSDEIDHSVLELFQLAESFNGEYDGWGAEIISDNSGLVQ